MSAIIGFRVTPPEDPTHCAVCKAPCARAPYRHIRPVGQFIVIDTSGTAVLCSGCGDEWLWGHELHDYELRAARLVMRTEPSASGAAFEFARKALGRTRDELSDELFVTPATVRRAEIGGFENTPKRLFQLALVALIDEFLPAVRPPCGDGADLFVRGYLRTARFRAPSKPIVRLSVTHPFHSTYTVSIKDWAIESDVLTVRNLDSEDCSVIAIYEDGSERPLDLIESNPS